MTAPTGPLRATAPPVGGPECTTRSQTGCGAPVAQGRHVEDGRDARSGTYSLGEGVPARPYPRGSAAEHLAAARTLARCASRTGASWEQQHADLDTALHALRLRDGSEKRGDPAQWPRWVN